MQHLAREVPVVERLSGIDALIALQPDEPGAEHRGQRLGEAGLADTCVAFEEQRPVHAQGEERRRGKALVGQVAGPVQRGGKRRWLGEGGTQVVHPSSMDYRRGSGRLRGNLRH